MYLIRSRLNEGFVEEDFFKVIDIKSKQWLNTNMEKFLRPETLFSNKFEGYLNEEYIQKDNLDNIEKSILGSLIVDNSLGYKLDELSENYPPFITIPTE